MVINTWFANAVPHFSNYNWSNSVIKNADRQWTIDNLMNQMELMIQHDDYMKSQDRNYKTPKAIDDEFNRYKKELDGLWVSFDDFRWWYYQKHPTPDMEARDKAWKALNNAFYNALWPSPKQEPIQQKWRRFRYSKPNNRVIL